MDQAIRMLAETVWKDRFAAQVTHRFGLGEATEALDTVRQWRSNKAVLTP